MYGVVPLETQVPTGCYQLPSQGTHGPRRKYRQVCLRLLSGPRPGELPSAGENVTSSPKHYGDGFIMVDK